MQRPAPGLRASSTTTTSSGSALLTRRCQQWQRPIAQARPATGTSGAPQLQRRRVAAAASSSAPPSLQTLAEAAGDALTKLQRYVQPPPPGFPPGPSGDQSLALLADPLACISRLRREHGPVVGLLLGGERVVLVSDPEAARHVLVEQADVFVKAGTAFFPGSSLTGNGLLVSDGDVWRRQRRLSNPAFRKTAVDRYAQEMVTATARLLDGPFAAAAAGSASSASNASSASSASSSSAGGGSSSSAGGVLDVYAAFNQLTLNITLAALFGIREPSDSDSSSSSGSAAGRAATVVAAVERAFTYFAARGATAMVVPEWVPTAENVAFKDAVEQLDALVYGIIDERQAQQAQQQQQQPQQAQQQAQQSQHPPPDLLQALLDSTDDDGQPMARRALRDEAMTLLVAGQETSAILLAWAAALLAYNPRVQAAAAAEVAGVLGSSASGSGDASGSASSGSGQQQWRMPEPADIPRLPLLTAVVLEALRLWSPAYMVGRCACRATSLPTSGGAAYSLPAGTTCLVSPYLLHRDATRWRQPSAFKPERWLHLLQPGQAQAQPDGPQQPSGSSGSGDGASGGGCPVAHTAAAADGQACPAGAGASTATGAGYSFAAVLRGLGPNGAFVPFGGGPRNCIGAGFAMTEALLVLAALLARYELAPPSPAAGFPRPKPMLTLRPEAVPLRLTRRGRA